MKFAVAWFSLHNGELKLKIVEAASELEAAIEVYGTPDIPKEKLKTLNDLWEYVSDDDWVEVLPI